jgi:hypothetical protein
MTWEVERYIPGAHGSDSFFNILIPITPQFYCIFYKISKAT